MTDRIIPVGVSDVFSYKWDVLKMGAKRAEVCGGGLYFNIRIKIVYYTDLCQITPKARDSASTATGRKKS